MITIMATNERLESRCGKLREMFQNAAITLGVEAGNLKDEQEEAAVSILEGKDTFVNLPTGFGKSLLYQALPLCTVSASDLPILSDYTRSVYAPVWTKRPNVTSEPNNVTNTTTCTTSEAGSNNADDSARSNSFSGVSGTVIVISPLTSLINDQIEFLKRHGVSAVNLASMSKDEKRMTEEGRTGVIFTSPECLLGFGLEIVSRPAVQKRLRRICIDESHCVVKWGQTSGKLAAFRESYSRIAEVRSVIPRRVPFMALTATASLHARSDIIHSLCMCAPTMIVHSPEKVNIRYSVIVSKQKEDPAIFRCVADELTTLGLETLRTIIFCRTHRQVRNCYSLFKSLLSSEQMTMVAMYHSTTEDSRKEMISRSFQSPDGDIRVLFCTVAFGMGVNVKGVTRTLHFGPPEGIDDYVQESGRAGRGGEQSHAMILFYRGCFRHLTSSPMKGYLKNSEVCRRKLLLQPFGHEVQGPAVQHLCCDVCSAHCKCADDNLGCAESMNGASVLESHLIKEEEKNTCTKTVVRDIIEPGKLEELKEALSAYRSGLLQDSSVTSMHEKVLCGEDGVVGFPSIAVEWIVQDAKYIDSADYFSENYPFFHSKHAQSVWNIFLEVIGQPEHITSECIVDEIRSNESETESSSSLEDGRGYRGVVVETSSDTD